MRELTLNEVEEVSGAVIVPAIGFTGRVASGTLGLVSVGATIGRDAWNDFSTWWGQNTSWGLSY